MVMIYCYVRVGGVPKWKWYHESAGADSRTLHFEVLVPEHNKDQPLNFPGEDSEQGRQTRNCKTLPHNFAISPIKRVVTSFLVFIALMMSTGVSATLVAKHFPDTQMAPCKPPCPGLAWISLMSMSTCLVQPILGHGHQEISDLKPTLSIFSADKPGGNWAAFTSSIRFVT